MKITQRQKNSCLLTVIAAGLLLPAEAGANAWLRSGGEHMLYTSMSYSTSYKYWDKNGDRKDKSDRSRNCGINLNYEYGLSYYYTLYAGTDFSMDSSGDSDINGFGDVSVGVRGRIDQYRNGRAWHITTIVPTGYSRNRNPRLGYGRLGLEAGVAFQFLEDRKDLTGYGEWGVSLRGYEGPPATQLSAYVKWNQDLSADPQGWKSWAKLSGTFSPFDDGEAESGVSAGSSHYPEYDVINGELGLKHPLFTNWTFSMALDKNLWGRNAADSWGARLGLSTTWQ